MSRVVSLREVPKALPSNRRRTLSPPNEEGLKVLQCASAAFFIALVGTAVRRLAARYTWATPIKIWYVKNWVGCLVPWIMRAAQTSYFKVRLPSLMYYEFVLPWSTPAYTWMTAYLMDKERSQREPMQGEVKTGLLQQYHHKVGKDEPPEAAAIREDIKFGVISKEYARSLTLFWYRGALFDIQHKRGGLHVRVYGLSRRPFLHLLAHCKSSYKKHPLEGSISWMVFHTPMSFQTSLKEYPARKLVDTVLEDHVREKLQSVARDFAPTEAKWFQNRGLLWRRGLLLVGPSGSGKRSAIRALAGSLPKVVHTISLTHPSLNDEELESFMDGLSHRAVVWLRDFDGWLAQQLSHTATPVRFDASETVPTRRPVPASAPAPSAARQSPRRAGSVSPTGLARFLECAHPVPKPGVIVLMTAESLEGVSESLLQPGRIDCVLHFKNATRSMAEHLFRQFFMKVRSDPDLPYTEATVELASKEWARGIKDGEFNLSTLKNMLVEHVYDPEGAAKAMPAWIAKRRSTRDMALN